LERREARKGKRWSRLEVQRRVCEPPYRLGTVLPMLPYCAESGLTETAGNTITMEYR